MNPIEAIIGGGLGLIGTMILLYGVAHFAHKAQKAEEELKQLKAKLNYSASTQNNREEP